MGDLAKNDALPAHLQQYLQQEGRGNKSDLGEIHAADVGMNMFKLCQSQSNEAKDAWCKRNNRERIKPGTMFLSRDGTIIPDDSEFIPLVRTKTYIKWVGNPPNSKMEGYADIAGNVPDGGLAFRQDKRTGKTLPPEWTEYTNFFVMTKYCMDEPVLLSFKRTTAPIGRELTRTLIRCTKSGKLPMCGFKFKLKQAQPSNDGNDNFVWVIEPSGTVPEKLFQMALKLKETAEGMSRLQSISAAISGDESKDGGSGEGKTVDADVEVVKEADGKTVEQTEENPFNNVGTDASEAMASANQAVRDTSPETPDESQQPTAEEGDGSLW